MALKGGLVRTPIASRCARRLAVVAIASLLAAPAPAQTFDVMPERQRATVGDSIPLHARIRIENTDLLLDSTPRVLGAMPRGMQVLAADRVVRQSDRTFAGRIVVAFYRPGRQQIPPFGLTYRRNLNVLGATLRSEPAEVEIVPVLPGGSSPRMQDIKPLESTPRPGVLLAALVLLALTALAILAGRVRRARRRVVPPPAPAPRPPPHPLEEALERLRRIEREQWPRRGNVARHYEAVVDVLRGYLASAERIPAPTRTTAELLQMLPSSLTPNGVFEQCRGLLAEADLVKFAGVRPVAPDAERFLSDARQLLTRWGGIDAVR